MGSNRIRIMSEGDRRRSKGLRGRVRGGLKERVWRMLENSHPYLREKIIWQFENMTFIIVFEMTIGCQILEMQKGGVGCAKNCEMQIWKMRNPEKPGRAMESEGGPRVRVSRKQCSAKTCLRIDTCAHTFTCTCRRIYAMRTHTHAREHRAAQASNHRRRQFKEASADTELIRCSNQTTWQDMSRQDAADTDDDSPLDVFELEYR